MIPTTNSIPAGATVETTTTAPSRSRIGLIAKVSTVIAASITLMVGFVAPAGAASVSVAQVTGLKAEAPYVHRDIIGRKWIYGASSTNSTAAYAVKSELWQYYGGRWNRVATNSASGPNYTNRAIARVLCTGAYTNYSFFTRAWVRYGGNDYYLNSRVVTQSC